MDLQVFKCRINDLCNYKEPLLTVLPRFTLMRDIVNFFLTITVCVAVAILPCSSAPAQSPKQIAEITRTLSPEAQQIMERLSSFDNLPTEEWRYHVGDLAHGESPNLDDSSWPLVKPISQAPTDAVWYRQIVEVPKTLHGYDLTGSRIWFHFLADANGSISQIIYFNGRRVAMGEDLEPIVFLEQAKPGDKVLVAVKLLHTVDKKRFAGAEMRIDFAPDRPSPEDLRLEFISAALLVPFLGNDPSQEKAT